MGDNQAERVARNQAGRHSKVLNAILNIINRQEAKQEELLELYKKLSSSMRLIAAASIVNAIGLLILVLR